MKKLILLFATFAMSLPALATVEYPEPEPFLPRLNVENGAIPYEEAQQLRTQPSSGEMLPMYRGRYHRNDDLALDIIGGVIGAIRADIYERDYYYHDHRVVCYAENRRRELFRAVGYYPRRVQDAAMRKCFDWSRQCRPLGCRRY